MTKAIYTISIVGAALLVVATLWLVWLNRSPKIFTPLLTVAVGAVVTAFITLCTVLKPTKINARFPVSVVLNRITNLPAHFQLSGDLKIMDRERMAGRANQEETDLPGRVRQRSVNFVTADDKAAFYNELVQLELVWQIYGALVYDVGLSSTTSAHERAIFEPAVFERFRPENITRIAGREVASGLAQNRFMNRSEQRYWNDAQVTIPLPVGARIVFSDSQSVTVERPGYYRLRFRLEPIGGGNGVPRWLANSVRETDVETIAFTVNMDADFDRFTAENPDTSEAKKWTESLFAALKRQFGDS